MPTMETGPKKGKGKGKTSVPTKKGKKGCFITSACVEARGLPDDCEELATLRGFRDGYLSRIEGGQGLIELYYSLAPAILAEIKAREDAAGVLKGLYAVIRTCVEDVRRGRNDRALATYTGMMGQLAAQYCPAAAGLDLAGLLGRRPHPEA